MNIEFDCYIRDVKSQLWCNASDDYKCENITFAYSEEQIEKHLDYFKDCLNRGVSAYLALTLFYDFLDDYYESNKVYNTQSR